MSKYHGFRNEKEYRRPRSPFPFNILEDLVYGALGDLERYVDRFVSWVLKHIKQK